MEAKIKYTVLYIYTCCSQSTINQSVQSIISQPINQSNKRPIKFETINAIGKWQYIIQSNLGSQTPRIMNSSVYEQIFRTQSVSDDVLCLEVRTRKLSKRRQNKSHWTTF